MERDCHTGRIDKAHGGSLILSVITKHHTSDSVDNWKIYARLDTVQVEKQTVQVQQRTSIIRHTQVTYYGTGR